MGVIQVEQHREVVVTVRLVVVIVIHRTLQYKIIRYLVPLRVQMVVSEEETLAEECPRAACRQVVLAVVIQLLQAAVILAAVADKEDYLYSINYFRCNINRE